MRSHGTWEQRAVRELGALARTDVRQALRIIAAVEQYLRDRHGDVRKLENRDEWRLRVGDWRVLFVFESDEDIRIVRIVIRRDAYD